MVLAGPPPLSMGLSCWLWETRGVRLEPLEVQAWSEQAKAARTRAATRFRMTDLSGIKMPGGKVYQYENPSRESRLQAQVFSILASLGLNGEGEMPRYRVKIGFFSVAIAATILAGFSNARQASAATISTAPSTPPPPVLYLASADSSSTTNSQSNETNYVFASASKIANAYMVTAIRLSSPFNPQAPEKLCSDPTTKATVRPQDLLLVFSIGRADQAANKFTGGESERVELNFTRIICPAVGAGIETLPDTGGTVSTYWGSTSSGSYSHYYWANPVSGIAAIAALLTSPWINTYRLWLTVPSSILDSFKNDQSALEGTIYCATASGILEALHDGGVIDLQNTDKGLFAFRLDTVNRFKMRVRGVNRCQERQPTWPTFSDQTPLPLTP